MARLGRPALGHWMMAFRRHPRRRSRAMQTDNATRQLQPETPSARGLCFAVAIVIVAGLGTWFAGAGELRAPPRLEVTANPLGESLAAQLLRRGEYTTDGTAQP